MRPIRISPSLFHLMSSSQSFLDFISLSSTFRRFHGRVPLFSDPCGIFKHFFCLILILIILLLISNLRISLFLKGQALLEPKSALIFRFAPGSITSIDSWFYRVVRPWSKPFFIRILLNWGKSCNQISLVIG